MNIGHILSVIKHILSVINIFYVWLFFTNANLEYYYFFWGGNPLNSKVVNFDILSARPDLYKDILLK